MIRRKEMKTMKDELKNLLFKTVDDQMNAYLHEKEMFGTYSESARLEHAKFCVLYDLLERAGFESEYIEMKYEEKKNTIDRIRQ